MSEFFTVVTRFLNTEDACNLAMMFTVEYDLLKLTAFKLFCITSLADIVNYVIFRASSPVT
jgi:hypothetical protein